jgi:hypothetical protein
MKFINLFLATAALISVPLCANGQQRPPAAKLFPESTVVYVQINDLKQLIQDMQESNFGRLLQDEKMRPFVEALYGEALDAYQEVKDDVGFDLEELMSIPTGEICFGLISPKDADMTPILIVDVNPDSDLADRVFDRGVDFVETQGGSVETETFADLKDSEGNEIEYRWLNSGGNNRLLVARYQNTYIFSNNETVTADVMSRWLGQPPEKDRTLAENRKFITIMNRCKGTRDEPAEMAFFVDPIEIAKAATRDNFVARATMAGILPILGLDGLLGVGGSTILNEEGFESVVHMHVLLSNPKTGIFDMIALRPGIDEPEIWAPANATNYMTSHWDVKKLFRKLEEMIDTANEDEGLTRREIEENINEEIGIDLVEDVIYGLEGRLTWVTWNDEKVTFNSGSNILGVKLNDPDKFAEVIEIVVGRANEENENLEKMSHQGYTYWQTPSERIENRMNLQRERNEVQFEIRPPQPCFGIVDDYFIFSENPAALRYVMDTAKGDHESLANSEGYKTIMTHMKRQLGTNVPSLTMYSNPAEQMEWMFELVKSEDVDGLLAAGAEDNRFVAGLRDAIKENPLPDFEDVAKYFPPSGGFMTVDEAGYHFMVFQLRSEDN